MQWSILGVCAKTTLLFGAGYNAGTQTRFCAPPPMFRSLSDLIHSIESNRKSQLKITNQINCTPKIPHEDNKIIEKSEDSSALS
jgi:hypothetical protein